MQLVALKKISAKLPAGALFEQPERQARMLIAIGVARAADITPEPERTRRTYRRRDLQAST